jgi:hypothetical protein
MTKDDILYIIRSLSPSIQRVQPAAARTAIQLVKDDSDNVRVMKGLHQVGKEHIVIKRISGGPSVHLFCMNYTLVQSALRPVYDDVIRGGSGWRITGTTLGAWEGDAHQGMDKTGEINTASGYAAKKKSQTAFRQRHY